MPKRRITERFGDDPGDRPRGSRRGYRRGAMVRTPWGDSGGLRDGRLSPGPGTPPGAVAENQRRRLFAALVAAVAEKGYEATRVEDLVALSGVSRKAFYERFSDKQDCFLAAVGSLVEAGVGIMLDGYNGAHAWEERVHQGLDAFMALLAAQPAAARLCFVDVYAAGAPAVAVVERAFGEFEAVLRGALEEVPERAGMPAEIVRAIVGGLRKVIHTRLHRGREEELVGLVPDLVRWGLSYLPPPEPLRAPRARRAPGAAAASYEPPERILRALAAVASEKGYPAVTVTEVAERAGTSLSTFYAHFAGKEEAMLAALDAGTAQMLAAVLPAYRRVPEWPAAIRAAHGAMLGFGAAEPEYTQLGAVEAYAAGPRALEQRDGVMDGLTALLAPGYERAPRTPAIASEAIAGAIYALVYDQVKAGGAASLPEIAPLATYVTLCPFLGPEEAVAVANGDGRRR